MRKKVCEPLGQMSSQIKITRTVKLPKEKHTVHYVVIKGVTTQRTNPAKLDEFDSNDRKL